MYKNLSKPLIDFSETLEHSPLYHLCEEILKLPQKFWLRLLYIHPDHFNPDVLDLMQKDSRLLPYFDIPFQSGDDSIIKKMNRKGTAASYKKIVSTIREKLPESCIRTTFLTGFPGEGDKEASNTESFLKDIKSDWSGCFDYSREEDTPAYSFKKRVSKKEAKKRADELSQIQQGITEERLKVFKNQEVLVLVEEVIDTQDDSTEGLAIGRSWFQAPEVDGCVVIRYEKDFESEVNAVKPGNVIKANVLAINNVDLDARFISLEKSFESSLRFLPQ
jgi:ribosomal protein S12 methylthiotransferase